MAHAPRLLLLAAVLVAALATPAMADPFVSKAGRFSFAFPTAPTIEDQTVDTADGKLVVHLLSADLPNAVMALVSYTDYPNDGGMTAAQRLQATLDGEVNGMRGTVVARSTCAVPHALCAEVTYSAVDDGTKATVVKTTRNVLVGRRMYQVAVATIETSTITPAQIAALLGTFKLRPR